MVLSDLLEKDNTLLQLPEFEFGDSFFRRTKENDWEKIGKIEHINSPLQN